MKAAASMLRRGSFLFFFQWSLVFQVRTPQSGSKEQAPPWDSPWKDCICQSNIWRLHTLLPARLLTGTLGTLKILEALKSTNWWTQGFSKWFHHKIPLQVALLIDISHSMLWGSLLSVISNSRSHILGPPSGNLLHVVIWLRPSLSPHPEE